MADAVVAAEKAMIEAGQALNERRADAETELREVRQRHAPLIAAAERTYREAVQAHRAARSEATPDHEWEGRRVFREDVQRDNWSRTVIERKRIEGVVFTYRPGVDLGPGHKWNRPEIGQPYVRLLKKDGTPGAKTERLGGAKWGLVVAYPTKDTPQ